MWGVASFLNKIFGILLLPFKGLHPAVGLIVCSVVTGIVMLVIFGKTSNQTAIHAAKGRLKAHIAEIWLFRNDLLGMMVAVVRVLAHTGRYFAHSMRPLIFLLLPVLIIMVLLGVRYQLRPFFPDETAIVAVAVDDVAWTRGDAVQLIGSPGVEITGPPLRMPRLGEINWKIRAVSPGEHKLTLRTPNGEVTKKIQVMDPAEIAKDRSIIAAGRGRTFSSTFLLFPVEPPLLTSDGISQFAVEGWPTRNLRIFGFGMHWLIVFFIVSVLGGLAVKDLFGVEV